MGTIHSNQSQNISNSQQTESAIDPLYYVLGKSLSIPGEKNSNRLDSISYSEQISNLPRRASAVQKSAAMSNFPASPPSPLLQYKDYSMQQKFKCDQCGMVFSSDGTLFKHKTRFCIGVKDSGIGRKPNYSEDEEIGSTTNHTKRLSVTIRKTVPHSSSIEKNREEVGEWKRQRAIFPTVEDTQTRILVDQHKTQKITDDNNKKQDNIYNEILLEYERLRTHEQDVLRHLYVLQTEVTSLKNPHIKLKQTIGLTDNQKKQFEELKQKSNRLQRERQIIQQKLEDFISTNYQSSPMSNNVAYRLLCEMKEQQEHNEKALEFLRGGFMYSNGLLSNGSDIPSLPYINNRLRRSDGDTVRSFRQSYLLAGGHDPRIIARSSDLEHKLRSYEDKPEPLRQARYDLARAIDPTDERLQLVSEEHQRLKTELDDIHQKFDTLDSRTRRLELSMPTNGMSNSTDYSRYLQPKAESYSRSQSPTYKDNNDYIYQHQPDHYTSLPNLDRRLTPRASPAIKLLDSNMYKLHDSLARQSYEPTGGFVVFFDFILNLPSTTRQCCLVTCLHHPKSGLGEPSVLEPTKCNQYIDEKTGERMNIALIATKQPVLRCPPQQALTIVIEIQTSLDRPASETELRTNAWVKLPLFDNKNRLSSGRWKVPLKALPINHNESLAVIGRFPTYGRAELYYRLVNSQDEDEQSNAPLSPSFKDLYAYPPQYRN